MKQTDQPIPSPFTPNAGDLYHDAMELLQTESFETGIRALQLLEQAYKIDPSVIELQLGYVEAYNTLGIHASIYAHIETGYLMVQKRFPTWPERLEWGDTDNRGYLRMIQCKADWLWSHGDEAEAKTLYYQLLQLNPHDNQGIRYVLAAMYAGLSDTELDALWEAVHDTHTFDHVEAMLTIQNKKHGFWDPPLDNV